MADIHGGTLTFSGAVMVASWWFVFAHLGRVWSQRGAAG
jgi:hypothetical protein